MQITDQAKEIVSKILLENNATALRVQIIKGCCGPSVSLSIATPEKDEELIDVNGINVWFLENAFEQTEKVVLAEKEGQLFLDDPNANC